VVVVEQVLSNPEPSNDVGRESLRRGRSGLSTCARGAAKRGAVCGGGDDWSGWAQSKQQRTNDRQTDVSD
jgi:hypothetical protein